MQRCIKMLACFMVLVFLFACTASDGNAETVYLIENSEENTICVAYPNLQLPESNAANNTIKDFVQKKISEICLMADFNLTESTVKLSETTANYQNTYLNIDYRITYCTEDLISIVFEGLYNYKKAAHPIHLLFSLNMDPASGKQIAFTDRYVVDENLYEVFAAQAEMDITEGAGGTWPKGWGAFSEMICSKSDFLTGLVSEVDFHVFYTTEGVEISYPVPYAMGNHLEVALPYSVMTLMP